MDFEQIESSQRQHHQELEHSVRMNIVVEQQDYNLFALLKPKIFKDGDQWCVLLGENIQEGICGFGKRPIDAIVEFNKAFFTPAPVEGKGE